MAGKPSPTIREIEEKTDEFFSGSDANKDNKITLKEFKSYIKKDKQVLEVLLNMDVAKQEDIKTDFGGLEMPEVDSELEEEINPPELKVSQKKARAKEGLEFNVKEKGDDLFVEESAGEGDQFMAVKPWKGTIDHTVPSKYKPSKSDSEVQ